jgi:GTP-binding protein EngB required for normal cell division
MACRTPPESQRTILFIGKTGSGKSRLINLSTKGKMVPSGQPESSTGQTCTLRRFIENDILYNLVDSIGLDDTKEANKQILDIVDDLQRFKITEINLVIVTLNGAEKLTGENTSVLGSLSSFPNLGEYTNNVLFCITYADGWNQRKIRSYEESLLSNDALGNIFSNGTPKRVYIGAPDPAEKEDGDDKQYAQCKEEIARQSFSEVLRCENQFSHIPNHCLRAWRQQLATQDATLREIAAERKKRVICTIL